MKVFVNAANLTGAGQRTTFLSLYPALVRALPESEFTVLCPNFPDFRELSRAVDSKFILSDRPRGWSNNLLRVRELYFDLPKLERRIGPDVCLSMGDVGPLGLRCPSVVFLNQPLFVYSKRELRGQHGWPLWKSRYLAWHFGLQSKRVAKLIVPIPVMADRVRQAFNVPNEKIAVIPLCTPRHVSDAQIAGPYAKRVSECGKPIKLLFLAAYYPHKNHQILPAVAAEIRRRGWVGDIHIFITLDEGNPLSERVRRECLEYSDVITNLGHVPMAHVGGVLRSSTALFLPTLAESFGNIYLEAFSYGLPVLTSDTDFARWMCRELGVFFDPWDAADIVDKIRAPRSAPDQSFSDAARNHVRQFPHDWDTVARDFARVLENTVAERRAVSRPMFRRTQDLLPSDVVSTAQTTLPKKVVQLAVWLIPKSGGTYESVRYFSQALNGIVYSFTYPEDIPDAGSRTREYCTHLATGSSYLERRYCIPTRVETAKLQRDFNSADLLICHCFWRWGAYAIWRRAKRTGTPYWVIPHGSLDPYVWSYRWLVKKVWFEAFGRRILNDASYVVCSSEREQEKVHGIAPHCRSVVVNWPVEQRPLCVSRAEARRELGIPTSDRVLLCLGRLHPMKRVTELVRVFCSARIAHTRLLIVGPGDDKYVSEVKAAADTHTGRNRITVCGAMFGRGRDVVLAASDGYVSNSLRENFGRAAADAMAATLPVILSPGNDLCYEIKSDVGWLLSDFSDSALARALEDFDRCSVDRLQALGRNGEAWAAEHFSIDRFDAAIRSLAFDGTKVA